MKLGADEYHDGALTRLSDARSLWDRGQWCGATYLGGRAVEAMFRALLWLRNRQQTTGHDLREMLKSARQLGMLCQEDPAFDDRLSEVAVLWHNNLRFVGQDGFLRHIKALRRDRRVKGDPAKAIASAFLETCEVVIHRGELAWRRSKKS